MALNINGRTKVKTLKSDFKNEFGLTLRLYDGRSFADDDATLASIRKGDSKGGEFSPKRNMKVGNFEDKMMELFGIKVQIAGSDDSYLCDNDLTLAGAQEADEKLQIKRAKKALNSESPEESTSESVSEMPSDVTAVYIEAYSDVDCNDPNVLKDLKYVRVITNESGEKSYYIYRMEGSGSDFNDGFEYIDTKKQIYGQGGPEEFDVTPLNEEWGDEDFLELDWDTAEIFIDIRTTAQDEYLNGNTEDFIWTINEEICAKMQQNEQAGTRYYLDDKWGVFKEIAQFKPGQLAEYNNITDLEY